MENAPLGYMVKMNKKKRGSSNVVTYLSSNMTAVRWKDNKVVNAICTFTHNNQFNRPNIIVIVKNGEWILNNHHKPIEYLHGGVDRMDQNTSTYMINLYTKKWCWTLFWFFVDVVVNNGYQIHHQFRLNHGEYRLHTLGFHQTIVDAFCHMYRKSFPPTTWSRGRHNLCHPANNLQLDGMNHWIAMGSQPWFNLPGCKESSKFYWKNVMLVFMLNVLNYITISRAVCKVHLR